MGDYSDKDEQTLRELVSKEITFNVGRRLDIWVHVYIWDGFIPRCYFSVFYLMLKVSDFNSTLQIVMITPPTKKKEEE